MGGTDARLTQRSERLMETISNNASDLIKIAIHVAGFDADEIRQRIMRHPHERKINERTVCRWLQEMSDAYRAAHGEN